LSLETYFHLHIFDPLGLRDMSIFPSRSMKSQLAYMNQRRPDGNMIPRDHLLHRSLIVTTPEEIRSCVNSGGAGLFAQPREYVQILATLLNDGISPRTGERILQKDTVDAMFQNQIPQWPEFGRKGIPAVKPDLTNAVPDLCPGQKQGWGLTFMLSDGPTGRSDGTAHFAGLPNVYCWCDREKGIAGMVASQILPFCDPQVLNLWVQFESGIYAGLQ
jgi:CubicO group peptidase (beta-lactamase class C family)